MLEFREMLRFRDLGRGLRLVPDVPKGEGGYTCQVSPCPAGARARLPFEWRPARRACQRSPYGLRPQGMQLQLNAAWYLFPLAGYEFWLANLVWLTHWVEAYRLCLPARLPWSAAPGHAAAAPRRRPGAPCGTG